MGLLAVGSLEENRCWGLASMHSFPLFQLMPTMIKYSLSRSINAFVNRNCITWGEWKEKAQVFILNFLSLSGNVYSSFINMTIVPFSVFCWETRENNGSLIEEMEKIKTFKGQPEVILYMHFLNISFRTPSSFTVPECYTIPKWSKQSLQYLRFFHK